MSMDLMDTNGWPLNLKKGMNDDKLICEISVTAKQLQQNVLLFCLLLLTSVAGHIIWSWNPVLLAIIMIVLLFIYIRSSVSKETLLLISSLGVQISSEYVTGRRVVKFIPFRAVQDIVIHEAVTMHKIVYYLAVLLKHKTDGEWTNSLVPVFMHSIPRLEKLQEIHASVHKMWDFEKHQLESFQAGGDNNVPRR